MNINFNKLISKTLPFFILFVILFIVTKIVYMQLPKESVEFIKESSKTIEYKSYNFTNSFIDKSTPIKTKQIKNIKAEYVLNDNILLQAIYQLGDEKGFAVILERGKNKPNTIGVNESFKGYKLISIKPTFVLFEKESKIYKLYMKDKIGNINTTSNSPIISNIKPTIEKRSENNYSVKKQDIQSYTTDLKKIWNNIGLKTEKVKGKPIGFKVYKLNNKSVFADLGLKKGDILTEANGLKLDSYQNAFKLYNKINSMSLLKFTILRDNQEMELEYEIK